MKAVAAVVLLCLVAAALALAVVRQRDSGSPGFYSGPAATPGPPGPSGAGRATRHVALNTVPADHPRLRALGYDVVDTQPDDASLAAVPAGMQALLWTGNFICGDFALSFEEFTAAVRRYGRDPRVYGWYLSDEPNPAECPDVVAEIRRRAAYVRAHAPGQVGYLAVTDWPMRPLAGTGVHVFGLDPYPCKGSTEPADACDIGSIDRMVRLADRAGIDRRQVAPVFQTFGQACARGDRQYWLPTEEQLGAILRRWRRLTPDPPLDVSYSWGRQRDWACPTLADADGRDGRPDLQRVMAEHNRRRD